MIKPYISSGKEEDFGESSLIRQNHQYQYLPINKASFG